MIPLTKVLNNDSASVRTLKKEIENCSIPMIQIVDQLVKKYCKELDNAIAEIQDLLKSHEDLDIGKINYYVMYLPILMYYAGNAIEDLGIEGDTAKAYRQEAFNDAYLKVEEKTVQGKTSAAQQEVVNEQVVENAFGRAYKKAKSRLELANTLHSALKKVLQWKISELEITGNHTNSGGTNFRRND